MNGSDSIPLSRKQTVNAKSFFFSFGILLSSTSVLAAEQFSCDNSAYDLMHFTLVDGNLTQNQLELWEKFVWTTESGEVFGGGEIARPGRLLIKEMQPLQLDDKTIVIEATNVPAEVMRKQGFSSVIIDRVSIKVERHPVQEGQDRWADLYLTVEENGQKLEVEPLICIID